MPSAAYPWIVLARVTMDGAEATGCYLDRYQTVREMRAVPNAAALVWKRNGSEADHKAATAFADADGYSVLVFGKGECDPLGKARATMLQACTATA